MLNVQPNSGTGELSSGNVAWTSLAVTDSHGSILLLPAKFPINAGLDSGTTDMIVPKDIYQQLLNYFEAEFDSQNNPFVSCNLTSMEGQLDFGFGNAITITVPFAEFYV